MEMVQKILDALIQYGPIIVPVLAVVLEIALRKVESKKPLSIADKALEIGALICEKFKLLPLALLLRKIKDMLNKVLPERLKPEQE